MMVNNWLLNNLGYIYNMNIMKWEGKMINTYINLGRNMDEENESSYVFNKFLRNIWDVINVF